MDRGATIASAISDALSPLARTPRQLASATSLRNFGARIGLETPKGDGSQARPPVPAQKEIGVAGPGCPVGGQAASGVSLERTSLHSRHPRSLARFFLLLMRTQHEMASTFHTDILLSGSLTDICQLSRATIRSTFSVQRMAYLLIDGLLSDPRYRTNLCFSTWELIRRSLYSNGEEKHAYENDNRGASYAFKGSAKTLTSTFGDPVCIDVHGSRLPGLDVRVRTPPPTLVGFTADIRYRYREPSFYTPPSGPPAVRGTESVGATRPRRNGEGNVSRLSSLRASPFPPSALLSYCDTSLVFELNFLPGSIHALFTPSTCSPRASSLPPPDPLLCPFLDTTASLSRVSLLPPLLYRWFCDTSPDTTLFSTFHLLARLPSRRRTSSAGGSAPLLPFSDVTLLLLPSLATPPSTCDPQSRPDSLFGVLLHVEWTIEYCINSRFCDTSSWSRLSARSTLFNTLHLLSARLLPPAVGPLLPAVLRHPFLPLLYNMTRSFLPSSSSRCASSLPPSVLFLYRRYTKLTTLSDRIPRSFDYPPPPPLHASPPPAVGSLPVPALTTLLDRYHAPLTIRRLPFPRLPPPAAGSPLTCGNATPYPRPFSDATLLLLPSLLRDSSIPTIPAIPLLGFDSLGAPLVNHLSNCITLTPSLFRICVSLAFPSLLPWPRFPFAASGVSSSLAFSYHLLSCVRLLCLLFFLRKFLPASCPANVLQASSVVKSDTSALAVTRIFQCSSCNSFKIHPKSLLITGHQPLNCSSANKYASKR
ncbi:hypothetical protein B0H13DRAFT_2316106 [Mycena leptocephala]|nr:hypothetical protein B0H13DRAFT_2316106 [Mycena leptocephala]